MKYLPILFLFTFISCYQPERNCTQFKTGTFEFETLIGTEVVKTTFVRTDSTEIDYFKGKADTSAIRWLNDCEFIVKHLNPKNMAEKKAIHMKILITDGDQYLFEYNIVGETRKEKGTARKINN